ncbi:hypothetical protein B0H14DRAFT_3898338 [Mycena olivaceomarginata]|nr:hypothetical protein B0H14DRAFT_3898338 [Mycena olivaceomarginata]
MFVCRYGTALRIILRLLHGPALVLLPPPSGHRTHSLVDLHQHHRRPLRTLRNTYLKVTRSCSRNRHRLSRHLALPTIAGRVRLLSFFELGYSTDPGMIPSAPGYGNKNRIPPRPQRRPLATTTIPTTAPSFSSSSTGITAAHCGLQNTCSNISRCSERHRRPSPVVYRSPHDIRRQSDGPAVLPSSSYDSARHRYETRAVGAHATAQYQQRPPGAFNPLPFLAQGPRENGGIYSSFALSAKTQDVATPRLLDPRYLRERGAAPAGEQEWLAADSECPHRGHPAAAVLPSSSYDSARYRYKTHAASANCASPSISSSLVPSTPPHLSPSLPRAKLHARMTGYNLTLDPRIKTPPLRVSWIPGIAGNAAPLPVDNDVRADMHSGRARVAGD